MDAPSPARDGPAAWPARPSGELSFPYMFWAHTHSARGRFQLSHSGMPPADPAAFADLRIDLSHAGRAALPALEARAAARHGVEPGRVIATLGASGGLLLCALQWLRQGARVVTDLPSYEVFRTLPRLLGADLRVVERRLEQGWRLEPAAVRAALAQGSGPGHLFFANSHNPTGALTRRAELAELAAIAAQAGGVLIACDLYQEFLPPEERHFAHAAAPNGVTISSLTKAYGLGPLRVGWIVLGEGLAHLAPELRDKSYLTWVDPPTTTLAAGLAALERLDELRAPLERIAREARPLLERWLRETDGITAHASGHGLIEFARVEGCPDTLALSEFLAREHAVDVVPGEFFGLPGHLRLGCGGGAAALAQGLEALARGLSAWRSR